MKIVIGAVIGLQVRKRKHGATSTRCRVVVDIEPLPAGGFTLRRRSASLRCESPVQTASSITHKPRPANSASATAAATPPMFSLSECGINKI